MFLHRQFAKVPKQSSPNIWTTSPLVYVKGIVHIKIKNALLLCSLEENDAVLEQHEGEWIIVLTYLALNRYIILKHGFEMEVVLLAVRQRMFQGASPYTCIIKTVWKQWEVIHHPAHLLFWHFPCCCAWQIIYLFFRKAKRQKTLNKLVIKGW